MYTIEKDKIIEIKEIRNEYPLDFVDTQVENARRDVEYAERLLKIAQDKLIDWEQVAKEVSKTKEK